MGHCGSKADVASNTSIASPPPPHPSSLPPHPSSPPPRPAPPKYDSYPVNRATAPEPSAHPISVVCRYHSTPGGCRNGSRCPNRHEDTSKPPCQYYYNLGYCRDGENCPFLHGELPRHTSPRAGGHSSPPPPASPPPRRDIVTTTSPKPTPPPPSGDVSLIPCQYWWGQGSCRDGDKCPYMHEAKTVSGDILNRLPSYLFEGVGDQVEDESMTTCQLCLETFTAGDVNLPLPCLHTFHKKCVLPWLKKSKEDTGVPTCPVCRMEVKV
eukprot:PhF_6_TR10970/c0_g1_i2/m.17703